MKAFPSTPYIPLCTPRGTRTPFEDHWSGVFPQNAHLDLQHAQGDLEENQGALIEEQVPDPQQHADVHHTGKRGQEPVEGDQGQLWGGSTVTSKIQPTNQSINQSPLCRLQTTFYNGEITSANQEA